MRDQIDWKFSFFDTLHRDLNNKFYLLGILLITVATYGFTFSNLSLGIDDFGLRYYLEFSHGNYPNMIRQGRLLHVALSYISGLVDVVPFLNNFLSALLMAVSGILMSGLFDTATGRHFTLGQKLLFFGLYISYPILAFKFIYDLDVLVNALSYACLPLAVLYGFSFIQTRKVTDILLSCGLTVIVISSYESFNGAFICAVLFTLILLCIYRNYSARQVFGHGLVLAGQLVVALAVYYGAVMLVQRLTNNPAYARSNIFTLGTPLATVIKNIFKKLVNPDLFFTVEFAVCAAVFVLLMVFFTVRRRRPVLLLLGAAFGAFLIATNILQGFLLYRGCQAFNLFIAGTALLLMAALDRQRIGRCVCTACLVLILLLQLKDINLWFYKDWASYQKNTYAIHHIATDLYAGYTVKNKPVCFVNRDYKSFLMSWDEARLQTELGESSIISSIAFLGDSTSDATFQLFEYQEYDKLIHPTKEQAAKAMEHAKQMPSYPQDGYIKELDDIIIVNIGKAS